MRRAMFGLIVVTLCLASAGALRRAAAEVRGLMLQVSEFAALQGIVAGYENMADGSFSTAPISDMMIELRPAAERPRPTAWVAPGERLKSFVDARLYLVSGGRIDASGHATCDRFDGEILVCQLACEGGAFGLRRGSQPGRHDLIVGYNARQLTQIRSLGFKIGACAIDSKPALLVLPNAGRLAVRIPLKELP